MSAWTRRTRPRSGGCGTSWWYDRFEIPHAIPADARRIEMEMGGEIFGAAPPPQHGAEDLPRLLGRAALHRHRDPLRVVGHAAFYLDRVPLLDALGDALENRFQRLTPGNIVWDPYIEEVTIAYGRNAFVNFPTTIYTKDGRPHPKQVCIFGRVTEKSRRVCGDVQAAAV